MRSKLVSWLIGASLLAMVAGINLGQLAIPLLWLMMIAIAIAVMFGAKNLTTKLVSGAIGLAVFITGWMVIEHLTRHAIDLMNREAQRALTEPSGLAGPITAVGIMLFFGLAGVVLVYAKVKMGIPIRAEKQKLKIRSRAVVVDPERAPDDPSDDLLPAEQVPPDDELGLFPEPGHE